MELRAYNLRNWWILMEIESTRTCLVAIGGWTRRFVLFIDKQLPRTTIWQLLQSRSTQISNGSTVLGLMLASDKTVISGNFREKAWSLYMKLGNVIFSTFNCCLHVIIANTPAEYRDKNTLHGNRLLAYFPIIESKMHGKTEWFRNVKRVIFHYCLKRIFAPFQDQHSYVMRGPGKNVYNCIPALASYSADMPEQ